MGELGLMGSVLLVIAVAALLTLVVGPFIERED
jgi:hypothetical protein